jgi:acyl-CoA reductase-like NAD-dependent aldehyde dehydrogenase
MLNATLENETHIGSIGPRTSPVAEDLAQRSAQRAWAQITTAQRLAVLRRGRLAMSQMSKQFAEAISAGPARTPADTRVAEILPLLAACKFLEQRAIRILAVRKLGRRGLPLWLAGVESEVQRVPFGIVLVIAPTNYPLFLPGVQTLQALAAGNAVVWKPGRDGKPVAELFAKAMYSAGLPRQLLQITEDSVKAGEEALRENIDKVIFTGSLENAKRVLQTAAEKMIPCTVEASGCDAVIVLPSANLQQVIHALVFGMRFNGSATCIAPRRIFVTGSASTEALIDLLLGALSQTPAIKISTAVQKRLGDLLTDAQSKGAIIRGEIVGTEMRPILVTKATPEMEITQADIFAPVLSVIEVQDFDEMLRAQQVCPFGLTVSIFGERKEARLIARSLEVGTVLINDLIVSTVDPRIPFGGRRHSGFGVTRGAEGLLEMTTTKVLLAKNSSTARQYEPTSADHELLFDGVIAASHSPTWQQRWNGWKQMLKAGRKLGRD